MFLNRTLKNYISKVNDFFPVVLITGPRQVGKTSLLEECAKENRKYVSLDSSEKEISHKMILLYFYKNIHRRC